MKRCWAVKCFVTIFAVLFLLKTAFAIGFWVHGEVNKAPWSASNYTYMVVNNVKYTIMKEANIKEVIEKKDAVYKTGAGIRDIRRGDEVLLQAEGNRIYQIEILR